MHRATALVPGPTAVLWNWALLRIGDTFWRQGRAALVTGSSVFSPREIRAERNAGAEPEHPVAPSASAHAPASRVLEELIAAAPHTHFTLSWVLVQLQQHSFGVIMLLLGILAAAPIGSMIPGLMLVALASQMVVGRHSPVFPQFIAARSLPTRHLVRLGRRATPALRRLETVVHPRWPMPLDLTTRVVGSMILLLSLVVLLAPVPLSNVLPAIAIAVISLGYMEEDGLLLTIGLGLGLLLLAAAGAAIWEAILVAGPHHSGG